MLHRSSLWIACRIIEPGDAGVGYCACAHRAWLQRYPQVASGQPVGTKGCGCLAHGNDFCMGSRVMAGNGPICAATDDFPVLDDQCPHRHFAIFGGSLCQRQRLGHYGACRFERH